MLRIKPTVDDGLMASGPGSSARRTRRAYTYQDLCTLHVCLEMLEGTWDAVTPEGAEDITCERASPVACRFSQVKTTESPDQLWTTAMVTRAERPTDPATSILGRLFTAKPMPDHAHYELVLNQDVAPELRPICHHVLANPADASACRSAIVQRLDGLAPAGGRTTEWCVDRLVIRIESRRASELEAVAHQTIARLSAARITRLLAEETADILDLLVGVIRDASESQLPTTLTTAAFEKVFADAIHSVTSRMRSAPLGPSRLSEKLQPTGMDDSAIDHAREMHIEFRRRLRSEVGPSRDSLVALLDLAFVACSYVRAGILDGTIAEGPTAYRATYDQVSAELERAPKLKSQFDTKDALAAVYDITARCRHRYVA